MTIFGESAGGWSVSQQVVRTKECFTPPPHAPLGLPHKTRQLSWEPLWPLNNCEDYYRSQFLVEPRRSWVVQGSYSWERTNHRNIMGSAYLQVSLYLHHRHRHHHIITSILIIGIIILMTMMIMIKGASEGALNKSGNWAGLLLRRRLGESGF